MTASETYISQTESGKPIAPSQGVVPLLEEKERGVLKVVGTGFYISRYGLVMSAKHVFEDLTSELRPDGRVARRCYVLHTTGEDLYIRLVRYYSLLRHADIAVVQADNFVEKFPLSPLINLRGRLTVELPPIGAKVVTYAYPENELLVFGDTAENPPTIFAHYFDGEVIEHVARGPYMPYPHIRTSIEIRSGASGGPVFWQGTIVGINCRSFDFAGGEWADTPLSSIIPIATALTLDINTSMVPPQSWEYAQIPESRRCKYISLAELSTYGHVVLN